MTPPLRELSFWERHNRIIETFREILKQRNKTMIKLTTAMVIAAAFASPSLAARTSCDSGAQENWMSKAEITSKAQGMGYEVRRIKAERGCYELYAISPEGQMVEAMFHPVTGELVNGTDKD